MTSQEVAVSALRAAINSLGNITQEFPHKRARTDPETPEEPREYRIIDKKAAFTNYIFEEYHTALALAVEDIQSDEMREVLKSLARLFERVREHISLPGFSLRSFHETLTDIRKTAFMDLKEKLEYNVKIQKMLHVPDSTWNIAIRGENILSKWDRIDRRIQNTDFNEDETENVLTRETLFRVLRAIPAIYGFNSDWE